MDHRKSIDATSNFLAELKARRLEESAQYDKFSDSKLKEIVMTARMQQHSLVRGSIAEMENTKRIECATLVLESRSIESGLRNSVSVSTANKIVKKIKAALEDGLNMRPEQKTATDLAANKPHLTQSKVKSLVREALGRYADTTSVENKKD